MIVPPLVEVRMPVWFSTVAYTTVHKQEGMEKKRGTEQEPPSGGRTPPRRAGFDRNVAKGDFDLPEPRSARIVFGSVALLLSDDDLAASGGSGRSTATGNVEFGDVLHLIYYSLSSNPICCEGRVSTGTSLHVHPMVRRMLRRRRSVRMRPSPVRPMVILPQRAAGGSLFSATARRHGSKAAEAGHLVASHASSAKAKSTSCAVSKF